MYIKININLIFFVTAMMVLSACSHPPEWIYERTIKLDGISPLGIVVEDNFLWISDIDNNKVLKVDLDGKILETYEDFERPMHISIDDGKLFAPEYGADTVAIIDGQKMSYLPSNVALDAPAAVDVKGDDYLIADFYNHRIVYSSDIELCTVQREKI